MGEKEIVKLRLFSWRSTGVTSGTCFVLPVPHFDLTVHRFTLLLRLRIQGSVFHFRVIFGISQFGLHRYVQVVHEPGTAQLGDGAGVLLREGRLQSVSHERWWKCVCVRERRRVFNIQPGLGWEPLSRNNHLLRVKSW